MKKFTAQKFYDSILENQVPCLEDVNIYFPETDKEIIEIVENWWLLKNELTNIKSTLRKISSNKYNNSSI